MQSNSSSGTCLWFLGSVTESDAVVSQWRSSVSGGGACIHAFEMIHQSIELVYHLLEFRPSAENLKKHYNILEQVTEVIR